MGLLFGKSEEEKKQEKLRKSEEEEKKIKEALQTLGADFDFYSDKEIKARNNKDIKEIKTNFWPSILSDLSVSLQMDSYKNATILRFSTIVYQNWILIRQNELVIRNLKKIKDVLKDKKKISEITTR